MIKKYIIFSFIILNLQCIAYADYKCSTKGVFTKCYLDGVHMLTVQNLRNGFCVVQENVGLGMGIFAQTKYMTLLEAQDLINGSKALFNLLSELSKEEKKQAKIKQANSKVIIKILSIKTSNGINITLEEDKNNDDFLTINSQRTKIGSNLVNGKATTQYTSSIYERAKAKRMQAVNNKRLPESYAEIISDLDCNPLFKVVYSLRDKYGISYEDAQKLMKFRNDNSDFRAEDLLIPEEISKREYNKLLNEAEFPLSNITFPKF